METAALIESARALGDLKENGDYHAAKDSQGKMESRIRQLERMLKAKPEDADLNARMAYEHFARRDYKDARPLADKALKLKPHHPLASYVKAQIFNKVLGDEEGALALLEPSRPSCPHLHRHRHRRRRYRPTCRPPFRISMSSTNSAAISMYSTRGRAPSSSPPALPLHASF